MPTPCIDLCFLFLLSLVSGLPYQTPEFGPAKTSLLSCVENTEHLTTFHAVCVNRHSHRTLCFQKIDSLPPATCELSLVTSPPPTVPINALFEGPLDELLLLSNNGAPILLSHWQVKIITITYHVTLTNTRYS